MATNKKMTTIPQALMIRKLYVEGESSMLNIAEQVGVSENTVRRIVAMDDVEWDKFMAKRRKHEEADAKPKKAVPKQAEPKPKPVPEEAPAGKCPKCGAAKPDRRAAWCWKCGADLRSERAMTALSLRGIADVLNRAIALLEAEDGEM